MINQMSDVRSSGAQIAQLDAIIVALAKLWPSGFAVYQRRRRPLAIGIDQVLIAQLEPAIAAGSRRKIDPVAASTKKLEVGCELRRALNWRLGSAPAG